MKNKRVRKKSYKFSDLVDIISILRSPQGCPWDRKQRASSYKDYLLEEVYELIEAINRKNPPAIKEEIGDVMLLLVMLAQIYKEKEKFDISGVIDGICRKLIRRHPHIFGKKSLRNASEVIYHWTKQKAKEKKRKTYYERLPRTAPALMKSFILFKEQRHLGEEEDNPALSFINLKEKKLSRQQVAESLFFLSWLSFRSGVNPEEALNEKVESLARRLSYAGGNRKKK